MTHSSGVNASQPTYDAIIKKTFTEINERPTGRQKDNLLVEVKKVLVGVSVPGFNWSSKYGFLAETRGGPAYERLLGKAYAHPPNEEPPKVYPNMRKKWKSGKKEKMEAEWNMYKTACFTRFGACDAICENIR